MVDKLYKRTKIAFTFVIVFSIAIVSLYESTAITINNNVVKASNSSNGAYFSNLDNSFLATANGDSADPTIIKGPDNCFYVFTTNRLAYKSCDSKTWDKWNYSFNTLPSHQYFWAPEVHKIGNYYYMLFSLITWGSNYPWSSNSFGSVYYARSTDLKNFEYLGEMPYGSSYFDGKVDNKNHIDGSLFLDSNGQWYYYYKLETREIPKDYQTQQIYGIKVNLNPNGTFYSVGDPQVIMRRNTESNPIDSSEWTWHCWQDGNYAADTENINEGPYVIKKGNIYYLTFSVGEYTNDSYHVVVATSTSPLGPFVRDKLSSINSVNDNQPNIRDFISGANYPNTAAIDTSRDSSKKIYGIGHGSILTVTNSDTLIGDYNEYYYVYHSNKYRDGSYESRKITIDSVGFSGNTMYVNGPTTDIQPLISGSQLGGVRYYKIPASKFSINSDKLTDGLRYSSMNISYSTYTTNTLTITFHQNSRSSLTDIWLYGNGSAIGNLSGTLYINEGTRKTETTSFTALTSGSTAKIQLPDVLGKVKTVRVVFNKTLTLSEVELVRNSQDNFYQVTFNPNGGSINKTANFNSSNTGVYSVKNGLLMYDSNGLPSLSLAYNSVIFNDLSSDIPTRSGYKFNGWFTAASGGTMVYDANGKAINGNGYWSNNLWVKQSDIILYAQWTQTTLPVPTITKYAISNGYIYIGLNTSIANFNLGISNSYTVKIYDKNNNQKTSGNLATSDTIKIYSGSTLLSTYKVVIKGDVTGTGTSTVADVAKLYQYLKGKITMTNEYVSAGNVVSSDNVIKVNDVAKLYQYIKGKIPSLD